MADIQVRVGSRNATKVVSATAGSGGTLGGLSDVDISNLANGSVLVYNASTNQAKPPRVKNFRSIALRSFDIV